LRLKLGFRPLGIPNESLASGFGRGATRPLYIGWLLVLQSYRQERHWGLGRLRQNPIACSDYHEGPDVAELIGILFVLASTIPRLASRAILEQAKKVLGIG
jgi:hypothetical protein